MQPAAQADAQGQDQGDLHQRTRGREQLPQRCLQQPNRQTHPRGKAGNALKARRDPGRQRKDAVKNPGSSPIPEHAGGQQRWG